MKYAVRKLSHYDAQGRAQMVDVSAKAETKRTAVAHAFVRIKPSVLKKLPANPKGNPLEVARFAGISAAKKTSELIPLCHPLALSKVSVEIEPDETLPGFLVTAEARLVGKTGVEMEALTAVSVACLTIYDMLKATDRGMRIESVALVEKRGGRSGVWRQDGQSDGG